MIIFNYIHKDVQRLVDDVLELEGDDSFDFLLDAFTSTLSRSDLYDDYIRTQSRWYFFLKQSILTEDYILAASLTKCIGIEQDNFNSLISRNCKWYDAIKDTSLIYQITSEMKTTYNL